MITIATLKHITSKNKNYTDALEYLLFQHDEFTNHPILNKKGQKLLREEYYINGINCEALSFDKECEILNEKYHKNQTSNEIKSHHYIISFDPRDTKDHNLTGEKAQTLGIKYAEENFPGHQVLVCTHTDGHNHSGNIHVHIVLNSLRKYDVPKQSFMERNCDNRAGYKHHLSKNYLEHLQRSVMKMCERENLYQVDLLSPSKTRITNKEYWTARRGQENLDKLNLELIDIGLKPAKTKFQTQKQYLRDAISDIASTARNIEEFRDGLQEKYRIKLFDKRERFSYLHPERNKNISERGLGTLCSREYLLQCFKENFKLQLTTPLDTLHNISKEKRLNSSTENPENILHSNYNSTFDYTKNPEEILFVRSNLKLVVDLQTCVKAQTSEAYAEKVKISNLQQMAKTIAYVQEQGFNTKKELQSTYEQINEKFKHAKNTLKNTEKKLKDVNEQIHFTGQYFANKAIFTQMLKSKNKKKFRQEHETEIKLFESAQKYLKKKHPDGKMPSMKHLKMEKENLTTQHTAQYETYCQFKKYQKDLYTVYSNVETILNPIPSAYLKPTKSKDIL